MPELLCILMELVCILPICHAKLRFSPVKYVGNNLNHALGTFSTICYSSFQDQVCCTAQTLLRVLSHGGYKQVMGTEESGGQ